MRLFHADYPDLVLGSLKQLFPDPDASKFLEQLPLFKWSWHRNFLKLHLVCRHRLNIAKFFFEMIHRWLLPGRRLDVSSQYSTDFRMDASDALYTIAEMTIRMDRALPQDQIEHNLKVIETEIRLGMVSVYHASRLLETHFSSPQERNGQLQEKITKLLERSPDHIDYDIFGLLQQFLVMSREEFKTRRSASHLSRLITAGYLFSRSIAKAHSCHPDKRHVRLKINPVILDLPWGPKEVLGIIASVNLIHPDDLFEEKHLLKAVQAALPGVKLTPDSTYCHSTFVYLEVEKENGELFSLEEQKKLKAHLPDEIRKSVEVPLKSIFMPRNEEEILKHIVTLSGELRYVKDLPQVILMFDEQKGGELSFTVILVRLLFPTSYSVQYLFSQSETILQFSPDRVKRIGLFRKRYPKEATVFRVHLSSQPYLRDDQTLDLFRARQAVFDELQKVLGELRDYTGGMLAKQVELIREVHNLLGTQDPDLEPFFHSLYPADARNYIHPEQVKNWFLLYKQLKEFPEDPLKMERDASAVYVIGHHLPTLDPSDFSDNALITARADPFLGYLFITPDTEEQRVFIKKFTAELHRENSSEYL